MDIVCLDLEGVLVPEIWIGLSERTGIAELRRTTRDEPDYDKLMTSRLEILDRHGLTARDIHAVIAEMRPLDGAEEFLGWLRERFQLAILSDTFYDLAMPLMKQLGYPALFCHRLHTDTNGHITGYQLRQPNAKRESVKAFKSLNYKVYAAGDSYNDTQMLLEAHAGILFCPPENVIREFPQFPVTENYEQLKEQLLKAQAAAD